MRLAAIVALIGLLWTPSAVPAASEPTAETPIRVLFFSAVRDETGTWQQRVDGDVLYRPGSSGYGWIAELPTSNEVAISETLTLPKPARIWPPQMIVSEGGRVGTATRRETPRSNYLYGFWAVADGDPPGEYELTLSLNGIVYRFHFRVTFQPGQW